jgi:hypothetical protein
MEATAMPFPTELTTPPVTKMNFDIRWESYPALAALKGWNGISGICARTTKHLGITPAT